MGPKDLIKSFGWGLGSVTISADGDHSLDLWFGKVEMLKVGEASINDVPISNVVFEEPS